ncbi:MAG TPA: hypothetical protein VEU11_21005 [Terriglobales bacterium]|nr:hypothetical protein [Terriglobales bacterium]
MRTIRVGSALALCLGSISAALSAADPASWVPARWDGGPLELVRRTKGKAPADARVRQIIANWYDPATLALLDGTPVNCLLVTFSAGAAPDVEAQQHKAVKEYARSASERGIRVLGIVYPGADPLAVAVAADEARLDGLVLDGVFPPEFGEKLRTAARSRSSGLLVIPIARDAATLRTAKEPLLALEGTQPGARDLAEMGIRAGASAEPWIESNIWLVRSLRLGTAWRPVWISHPPNPSSEGDYVRSVADAAVGGGRWIVALDDDLRVKLFHKDAAALETWHSISAYLQFAEDHAEWRSFASFGNLAIIVDTAVKEASLAEEYLNLVARRQVPYRLVPRSELRAQSLAGFRAVLAGDLDTPTEPERKALRDFAEKGGLVLAGPWWGNPPKDEPYVEVPLGRGRVAIYKDDPPNPESLAKDIPDLLAPEVIGLSAFNVPTAITYASTADCGKRVLVQLLNYAGRPIDRVTIRFKGSFRTARLYTPESALVELATEPAANGRTEVLIPKLAAWGALLLEDQN